MARTVRDATLDTRAARRRLKASGKPYYRVIDSGLHLGYRKGATGGKWVARWYVGKQAYKVETIATADDVIDADGLEVLNFSQAQAAARKLFSERKHEEAGLPSPSSGPYTVKQCMADYLGWMEEHRKSAADARYKANALILPDLGEIECAKLSGARIQKWLEDTAKRGARLRSKSGKPKYRELGTGDEDRRRRRATANRTFTILRAALNLAFRQGTIASDSAWRRVQPFKEVDAARVRYLSIDETKRVVNGSEKKFRLLVQGALHTGARYGELAAIDVGDFNADSGTVQVRKSKSGKGRHIYLAKEGIDFYSRLAAGRPASEPMFTKADGTRWGAAHQSRPMAEACSAGNLKPAASFHCLRHTYASLAIMNGAPLLVVAKNLGHSDTRMVEKHYGHLAPSFIADAIRAAVPKFGFKRESTVSSFRATP
ncbi:MAG TPA: site-specific integrase [Rhizomicrobium sp.]|nr:site-specific integrase [Rhizomicrobium sp.]